MTDPREAKLPKWARELLHEERLKTALRFPEAPPPDHDFWSGDTSLPCEAQGKVIYSQSEGGVFQYFVGSSGYLYRDASCAGFGTKGSGAYYLSFDDARLAHRWRLARKFAEALLAAETAQARQ